MTKLKNKEIRMFINKLNKSSNPVLNKIIPHNYLVNLYKTINFEFK